MLFKRGSTISAAEGGASYTSSIRVKSSLAENPFGLSGCQAEVGGLPGSSLPSGED